MAGKRRRGARPAETRTAPTSRVGWLVCLLLVVAVAAIYGQTARFGYVPFDDGLYVSDNPTVRSGLHPSSIAWAIGATHLGFWIPATWLSLMATCSMFGDGAGPQHLVNVSLHAASAVVLFVALRSMTRELWPSAAVAAVFAVHPLHVESVAWVTERKDVLCALFWFLAILVHARAVEMPSTRRRLGIAVLALLALAAKPMAVTLPFTLLILDVWPLGRLRLRPLHNLVYEKAPLFAISAAAAVVTVVAHAREGVAQSVARLPIGARLGNAAVSIVGYLADTAWPARLAVFYPYPATLGAWRVAGALAVVAAITAFAVWLRRRTPYLLAGWSWFLVTLAPVSGLVQAGEQARADRFAYVPLVGLAIVAAWGARDVVTARPSLRWPVAVASSIVVLALGVRAWDQTRTWRDGRTLFEHALAVTPDNAIARHDLGRALADSGELDAAIANYEAALRLDPERADTHVSLGAALQRSGRVADAQREYEEALRLDPASPAAHNNLGLLLAASGDRAGARAHYDEALRLDPTNVNALVNLASLEYAEGRRDAAIDALEHALAIDPSNANARANLRTVSGAH